MEHLTEKLLFKNCDRISAIKGSLKGLSGLFMTSARDVSLDGDEFYGIGQLIVKLEEELASIEDILRCGQDLMASERNGLN
jgi:hypothetical protein